MFALVLMCFAGCPVDSLVTTLPAGTTVDNLTDTLGDVTNSLKEEAVFQVLQEMVPTDPVAPATLTADEPANFAEDVNLYADASTTAVEISEASILADVSIADGGQLFAVGTLAGRFWNDVLDSNSDESGGMFRGRWLAANGQPLGVLRGEYRPLRNEALGLGLQGGGVFHGKFIDTEGHFMGVLRGRYGHAADGAGLFFGRWFDRHNRLIGILKGHWHDEAGTQGGLFAGRWAAFNLCDELATLSDPLFAAGDFGGLEATDELVELTPADFDPTPLNREPDLLLTEDPPCIDPDQPHGFLRGWHVPFADGSQPPDDVGIIRGKWHAANGVHLGWLIGHYVPEPPGNALELNPEDGDPEEGQLLGRFYGKYVDRTGYFRGFIRGGYGVSAHGLGVFRGHYYDRTGQEMGALQGRWTHAPERPGGPFFGIWFGTDLDL
ncbi:MAG: hypothetical protein ABIG44_10975 [Planctomycetota bacterium]